MDIACARQRPLGHQGTEDLVHKHRKQGDVADEIPFRPELHGKGAHTKRHTGLREERDTEITGDLRRAVRSLCADIAAHVFTEATEQDIDKSDAHDGHVEEDVQLQLRAADHEEERKERRGPLVACPHEVMRERADVAEHRAEHHADKERGKSDMHRADLKFEGGKRRGDRHKSDGHVEAVGIGVEEFFKLCQHPSHQRAEEKRAKDLEQRVDENGYDVHRAHDQRFGDSEGHGKDHKTDRIVQRDDGEKELCQGSLGLELTHDHQGGGGGGRGGDRAEGQHLRERDHAGEDKIDGKEGKIHAHGGGQSLKNADHKGLLADLAQILQAELTADGKGDKAERQLGDHAETLDLSHGGKAEAGNAERTEAKGSDQNAGDEVGGHGGQLDRLKQTGHQKPCQQGNRNGQ